MTRISRALAVALSLWMGGPALAAPPAVVSPPIPLPLSPPNGGTGYSLSRFYAKLVQTRAGTGNTRICAAGDSTTYGVGSQGSATTNLPVFSYPAQLSGFLTSLYGIKSHWNAWQGDQGAYQTLANDGRVSVGSAWSQGSVVGIGGKMVTASTATNALTFTPTTTVDTFRVTYATGPGYGVLSANVDGGTATGINTTTGAEGFATTIVSASAVGTHTLNLTWASGGPVNVSGVEAWDSTQGWVSVVDAGWSGSTTTDWSASGHPWSPTVATSWATLGCDLVLIDLGINDWDAPTGVPAYTSNLQAIISAAKQSADVVLLTPVPTNPSGNAAIATQFQYLAAIYSLAQSNGLTLVDNYTRWQSYSNGTALGLYADTFTHPNAQGYGDFALSVLSAIVPISQARNPLGYGGPNNRQILNAQTTTVTSSSPSGTALQVNNTSTNGKSYNIFAGGYSGNPGFFGVYDATSNRTPFALYGYNFQMPSDEYLGWTAAAGFPTGAAIDTGLNRSSVGVVKANGGSVPGFLGTSYLPKLSAAPTAAPGAGLMSVFAVAGTNSGTCKIQALAGTSTTPVTVVDNVGAGC